MVVTAAAKQIIEAALKLDPKEREHIAHELLQRRLHKIEAGEATFVSGDEVFARAEAILRDKR
jgi:hypothetical protein